MALKGDRNILDYELGFYMSTAADAGGIVSISTLGSGTSMDNGSAVVAYAAASSGNVPVGVLGNKFVSYDLTRQHVNQYAPEAQVGTKATIYTKGWVVTDMLVPGITVAAKDYAYMGASGLFTNAWVNDVATPKVGVFMSKKDENGFAKVSINLPA